MSIILRKMDNYFIGIMTGTSADALDGCIVSFDNGFKLIEKASIGLGDCYKKDYEECIIAGYKSSCESEKLLKLERILNDKTIEISVDEMDNITLYDTHKSKSNVEVQKDTTTKSTKFELNAPLAGNIFKIFAIDGEGVVKDQTLIILEAMKMETEIKSPEDGIVKQIHVKVGDSVNPGDTLIEFA